MSRSFLGSVATALGLIVLAMPAFAADLALYPRQSRYAVIDQGPNPYCGPRCGCPTVTFVRHRSLVQYYPSGFDPREREEPSYAYGGMRTYARFENPRCPECALAY